MSEKGHSLRTDHVPDESVSPPFATIPTRLLAMMIADSSACSTSPPTTPTWCGLRE